MNFPINSISDLEKLSHAVKWQYFEKLVAWIFEQNDFEAKQCVVVKTMNGKKQFDVIATKYDKVFLVECKKWRSKGQRVSALKSATRKHLERCDLYGIGHMEKKMVPMIVTLLDDDIIEHENVPIVPVMKLDWFLNNYESEFS